MNSSDPGWQHHTVLVTGCSGFLGFWLSQRLCDSGAKVIGLSRNDVWKWNGSSKLDLQDRFTRVQGSVADGALLERTVLDREVDTIFHLAAQSKVDRAQQFPRETFEVNIQGTWNLLEAVRNAGQPMRVVLASTDMVYEDSREVPNAEPYAASKACAEVIGKCYHYTYGLNVCVARTSNLYGGGDVAFQRIIPGTIRAVIRGDPPVINGNGLQERDYLYVEDAVTGYMLLAEGMERAEVSGQSYNFNMGEPVSVSSVVETILKLMGRTDLKPKILGLGGNEIALRHASSLKARQQLGWLPETTLESGLMKTIAWYRSHTSELRMEDGN